MRFIYLPQQFPEVILRTGPGILKALACFIICGFFLAINITTSAGIIYVSTCGDDSWSGTDPCCQAPDGPKATIQAAIDSAEPCDLVLVADGVYMGTGNRDIEFLGKAITVQSANGPENCIIDCQASLSQQHNGFNFIDHEEQDSVLEGFKIINGYKSTYGGPWPYYSIPAGAGIRCYQSCPSIINCNIENNIGGGIIISDKIGKVTVIERCIIKNNQGGGIYCSTADAQINQSVIEGNNISYFSDANGYSVAGILVSDYSMVNITNCLVVNNEIGIRGDNSSNINVSNCTVTGNLYQGITNSFSILNINNCIIRDNWNACRSNLNFYDLYNVTIQNCNIEGTDVCLGPGNIDADPGFVQPGLWLDPCATPDDPLDDIYVRGDYHLRWDSPCLDMGMDSGLNTDIDGNLRPRQTVRIDGSGFDIGAYEYIPHNALLAIDKEMLWFAASESQLNIQDANVLLTNTGTGTLSWQIEESIEWLKTIPTSGQNSGEIDQITFQLDPCGLSPGKYSGIVQIHSSQAVNSDRIINIFLYVLPDSDLIVPGEYSGIQAALDAASPGDRIVVQPGTYDEEICFSGTNVILTSLDPNNKLIVQQTAIKPLDQDSGYVVSYTGSEDESCELSGFSIVGNSIKGGIRGYGCEATIRNCILQDCGTGIRECHGHINNNEIVRSIVGGVYECNGLIQNCKMIGNRRGLSSCNGTISDCLISRNLPRGDGDYAGGLESCNGTISNCRITYNFAKEGGSELRYCDGVIQNSFIINRIGNALFDCQADILNCTIYNSSGQNMLSLCQGNITNCIIWRYDWSYVDPVFANCSEPRYCCIFGGSPGEGNIDSDPLFVNRLEEDFHLQSAGWRWDTTRQRWDYDNVTSRCIDAGNPGSPLSDEPLTIPDDPGNIWGVNIRINMGAYGGTPEASMPPYDWTLLADLTNDGTVNLIDFAGQTTYWLQSDDHQLPDLNRDGTVDLTDLSLLLSDWLATTSWFH